MADVGKQIKEGRHVGLDFYDLLIEGAHWLGSAARVLLHFACFPAFKHSRRRASPERTKLGTMRSVVFGTRTCGITQSVLRAYTSTGWVTQGRT